MFHRSAGLIKTGLCVVFLILTFFTGCRAPASIPNEATEISTQALQPEPTAAPDRVILVPATETDAETLSEAETLLRELATSSGLEFEIRQDFAANEITPDIKIAVFLNKPENLGSMAANASGIQFVAITEEDWNPGSNVTIIKKQEYQTPFLAGFLSALLAPNFRVGALLSTEDPQFNQAFLNGVQFFCGNCTPVVYPLNPYPAISTQAANSPSTTWQAAADQISLNTVDVLFVSNDAYSPELFNHLAAKDMALVGTSPAPPEAAPKWVATVTPDGLSPIREVWSDLVAGVGGKVINANFKITNHQFLYAADGLVWLSQGKLIYLNQTIQLLREGMIDPTAVFQ